MTQMFLFSCLQRRKQALTQIHKVRKGKMRGSWSVLSQPGLLSLLPSRFLTNSPGAAEARPLWRGSPFGWKMSPVLIFYF